MKTTKNLGLNMPDKDDFVEIDKINENTEKIDEELAKKADASGGDISETVITTMEESADEYPVPAAGDNAKTVLGKVQKFFGDIRNWMTGVCLLGQIVNNCVTDNAKLPLSAAQGKALMDELTKLNSNFNVLNTNLQKWDKINVTNWATEWFAINITAYKSSFGVSVTGGMTALKEIPQLTDINAFILDIPYGTITQSMNFTGAFQSEDSESATCSVYTYESDMRCFRVRPLYKWTVGATMSFSGFIPILTKS